MPSVLKTHSFTVAEFHRMGQVGILTEQDRVELMDGEIVEMTPIGPEHAACVTRLDALLQRQVGATALVRVQNPVRLSDRTELQPDIALLRSRADAYAQAHPAPDDILLVIEVGGTSAEMDRREKVPRYAQACIREVWVVDLNERVIEVYLEPSSTGYKSVRKHHRDAIVRADQVPNVVVTVSEILS